MINVRQRTKVNLVEGFTCGNGVWQSIRFKGYEYSGKKWPSFKLYIGLCTNSC